MKKIILILFFTVAGNIFSAQPDQSLTLLQQELTQKKTDFSILSESYQNLTNQFAALTEESTRRKTFDEKRVKQGLEKLQTAEQSIIDLQAQIKKLTQNNNLLQQENQELQKKLAEIALNVTSEKSRIQTENTQILKEINDLKEAIESNKEKMKLFEEIIKSLETEKQNLTKQNNDFASQINKNSEELKDKQTTIDGLVEQLRKATASANPDSTNLIQQLHGQVADGIKREKDLKTHKEELDQKLSVTIEELNKLKTEFSHQKPVPPTQQQNNKPASLDNTKHLKEIKIRNYMIGGATAVIAGLLFWIYKLHPHTAHA